MTTDVIVIVSARTHKHRETKKFSTDKITIQKGIAFGKLELPERVIVLSPRFKDLNGQNSGWSLIDINA